MRILVTGGAGFIGSHLVERLLAQGDRVRVLDNLSTGKRANLPRHKRLEFIEDDVRELAACEAAAAGSDAVFHLAAVASVQASIDDPISTHAANFLGTLNLLEAARRRGVARFVFASSAAVYGDAEMLPVSEESRVRPLSPYAADKLSGEQYLQFYARRHGLAATAFRFFNVYGPRQDPASPYSGVISIFAERIRRGSPVTLYGDGRQTRDFVYVEDLVQVLLAALSNRATYGGVFNVGCGCECSLLELLAELERLTGRAAERRHEPARAGDVRHSRAGVARLRAALGFVPVTPIRDGLAALLAAADEGAPRRTRARSAASPAIAR